MLLHSGHVGRHGELLERVRAHDVDALVDRVIRAVAIAGAVLGRTVAGEVLAGGEDVIVGGQRGLAARAGLRRGALQPVDLSLHPRDERRILAEGLIGAAPADVARHTQARGKAPLRTGRAGLGGRDLALGLGERRIARRAHADVVREDGRADHVPVAVDGVLAVDQRDLEGCGERLGLEAVDHVGPAGGRVRRRRVAAAGQQRAHQPRPQVVGRRVARRRGVGEHVAVGLRHLADLLGQATSSTGGRRRAGRSAGWG